MPTKLVIFNGVTILVALAYGYVLGAVSLSHNYLFLPVVLVLGSLFLALFLIQVLLIDSIIQAMIVILLELIAFLPFIYVMGNGRNFFWLMLALLLTFIAFFSSYYSGHRETKNMIVVSFMKLRKISLKKATLGIILFSTVAYVAFIDVKNIKISDGFIEYLSEPIEFSGRLFFLNFALDMKVQEFLNALVEKNLVSEINQLPPAAQQEIKNKFIGDFLQKGREITKVNIKTQWTLLRAIVEISNFQIKRIPSERHNLLLLGIGLALFLTAAGFTFVLNIIVGLLAWLIYLLLLKTDFIRIMYRTKTVEVIQI